jgi:hypothetical protein
MPLSYFKFFDAIEQEMVLLNIFLGFSLSLEFCSFSTKYFHDIYVTFRYNLSDTHVWNGFISS